MDDATTPASNVVGSPSAITALLRMDPYDPARVNDELSCEVTRPQFRTLAKANGWEDKTIRLLLNPAGVAGRKIAVPPIAMGRLRLTVLEQ